MSRAVLRHTVTGALVGFGLPAVVGFVQLIRTGAGPGALQPLLAFGVGGGVVGALAGPLVGAALERRRKR